MTPIKSPNEMKTFHSSQNKIFRICNIYLTPNIINTHTHNEILYPFLDIIKLLERATTLSVALFSK